MLQTVSTLVPAKRWIGILAVVAFSYCLGNGGSKAETAGSSTIPPMQNVLYGAAYYHEYMPYERLDQDVALMQQAGLTVVRMGESTWSLWEPADGHFEYAWMDRVVAAMGKAGIKVIMGTPTYSIPTWLFHAHPDQHDQQAGDHAEPEEDSPSRRLAEGRLGPDQQAQSRPDDRPHRGERLDQPEGERPGTRRHGFGHQRHSHRILAAYAHPAQKAIGREFGPGARQAGKPGEQRVDQDRQGHRPDPAPAITQQAEQQAAGRPAGDEQPCGPAGEGRQLAGCRRGQEIPEGRRPRQDEQPLIHGVEQPAEHRDNQHPSVRAGKLAPPGGTRGLERSRF